MYLSFTQTKYQNKIKKKKNIKNKKKKKEIYKEKNSLP